MVLAMAVANSGFHDITIHKVIFRCCTLAPLMSPRNCRSLGRLHLSTGCRNLPVFWLTILIIKFSWLSGAPGPRSTGPMGRPKATFALALNMECTHWLLSYPSPRCPTRTHSYIWRAVPLSVIVVAYASWFVAVAPAVAANRRFSTMSPTAFI